MSGNPPNEIGHVGLRARVSAAAIHLSAGLCFATALLVVDMNWAIIGTFLVPFLIRSSNRDDPFVEANWIGSLASVLIFMFILPLAAYCVFLWSVHDLISLHELDASLMMQEQQGTPYALAAIKTAYNLAEAFGNTTAKISIGLVIIFVIGAVASSLYNALMALLGR